MNKIKIKQKSNCSGFTLVELVIVIAIVIILSVVSVPIYRGYIDRAKYSEAYALLGTILSAQKAYYSEHGIFYNTYDDDNNASTCNNIVLGIDARGNKYFTRFGCNGTNTYIVAKIMLPDEFVGDGQSSEFYLQYNITKGSKYINGFWRDIDTSYMQ